MPSVFRRVLWLNVQCTGVLVKYFDWDRLMPVCRYLATY
jgi:hypothetical protein